MAEPDYSLLRTYSDTKFLHEFARLDLDQLQHVPDDLVERRHAIAEGQARRAAEHKAEIDPDNAEREGSEEFERATTRYELDERNELTPETDTATGYELDEKYELTPLRPPNPRLNSSNSSNSYSRETDQPPWPELDQAAYHGSIGQAVRLIAPDSEADPAAILVTCLTGIGAIAGNGVHVDAGHVQHPPRLNAVIVGETAKARKGTSWAAARRYLIAPTDTYFADSRIMGGFGSGEAVVDEVIDRTAEDDYNGPPHDGRLLIYEPEFAKLLRVAGRDGSILSGIIREAWDGTVLQTRSRGRKAVADKHSISVVGHITADELRRNLTETEAASGFANRFLWIAARRSRRLPFGSEPDLAAIGQLVRQLHRALPALNPNTKPIRFANDARHRWEKLYDELADDDPGGMLGAIVARGEPQVLRLALVYAVADGSTELDIPHLDAAKAVWDYSRDTALMIWGDALGDSIADRLLDAIRSAGIAGLTLTEQSKAFGKNIKSSDLARARTVLMDRGLIEQIVDDSGPGRPVTFHRRKDIEQ